jgi:hypothetical protein
MDGIVTQACQIVNPATDLYSPGFIPSFMVLDHIEEFPETISQSSNHTDDSPEPIDRVSDHSEDFP